MGILKTKEQFVLDANGVHSNAYDYSMVEYINSKTKIKIICHIHGMFEQIPNDHLSGHGCRKCSDNRCVERLIYNTDLFVSKANIKHNNFYDYSLVEYTSNKEKVKIICPIHGVFEQAPCNHLNGQGCPDCGGAKKYDIIYFIKNLTIEESPVDINGDIHCKCAYCKEYFKPTRKQLGSRVNSLKGNRLGESRLYCSVKCKDLCPIYNQRIYTKGNKPYKSRPDQPELKDLVLERDNNQCQRCGSNDNLHCHHITGIEINPVESADIDNCITLCHTCHSKIHSDDGCGYIDMRRKPCKIS